MPPTFANQRVWRVKWLVQAGDDPAYASPDFDDSHWTLFDPSGSIASLLPHHPEVVWYRLHVKVDPTQTGLALSEMKLSRAFEIYVNGERLMASGQVVPFVPYTSDARVLARIPDRAAGVGDYRDCPSRPHLGTRMECGSGPGFVLRQSHSWGREDPLSFQLAIDHR